ncbi:MULTISPECIES: MFS transporter [unclassified Janthinobacterium]|uniref:MFS transporter n=1 Tax=unclassified Janthinobacterium TaxID=2610881 RepID=UPI00161A9671|nr:MULTISPECIES: MFS transporter [unclassified Janthinobacterium]MBB5610641.1 Na+/melibiose symporter-like transporter [Janthinobacterium sp. S3T4]MBB5616127.1 Na+/melibiose symporter-like transporter [Janthinobacterium sp. S3M3]
MSTASDHLLGTPSSRGLTRAYAGAHFGKSLFWYASEILFAYFLTEVGHIPVRYMGLILAIGYFSGTAADLVLGLLLRRRLSHVMAACRLQCLGAVLSALTLVLLFLCSYVPPAWSAPYALLTGITFRIAYALYDLPQNALLSLATKDADSRSRVSSLRIFFSGTASFLIASAIAPLLTSRITTDQPARFLLLVLGLSLAAIVSAVVLLRAMRKAGPFPALPSTQAARPGWWQSLCGLPPGVWIVVAMIVLISGGCAMFLRMEPYYIAYVLKSPARGASIVMMASLGAILSQFLWRYLLLQPGKSRVDCLLLATMGLLVSITGFWLDAHDWRLTMACALGFGIFSGGCGTVLWAAFGDLVADSAKADAGLAYGLMTGSVKIALGCNCLMLGTLLDGIDYRGVQNGELLSLMCLPLMLACLLVMLLIWLWARTGLPARYQRYQ